MTGSPTERERSNSSLPYLLTPKAMFRLGLVLVLAAVAYFLRYSFEQGWIGDLAKVGMATGTGLAMIVAGVQIAPRRPGYGNTLQGGGGAILYLTAFATHQRYALTDGTGAFLMLVAVSAGVVAMALRQRSEALAIAGVTGALSAPVVIGGTIQTFPGDAGYLVAVLGVASVLYFRNRWVWLFGASIVGVAAVIGVELAASLFSRVERPAELQVAVAGLWLFGCGAAVSTAMRPSADRVVHTIVPVAATVAIPPVALVATLFVWDFDLGKPVWAAIAFGVAVVHLAAFAWLRPRAATLSAAQIAPAAVAGALGWIGSLTGSWILFAVAVQSAAMILAGVRTRVPALADLGHLFGAFTGLGWILVVALTSDERFSEADILTGLVVLLAAAVAFAIREAEQPHGTFARVYAALSLPAAMVWAVSSLGGLPQGASLVTAVWATIGFGVLIWGRLSENGLVRNIGIGVVLLAVAKLLVIDTAAAAPLVRIGLFAGIGLALLAVGYWLAPDDEDTNDPQGLADGAPAPNDREAPV